MRYARALTHSVNKILGKKIVSSLGVKYLEKYLNTNTKYELKIQILVFRMHLKYKYKYFEVLVYFYTLILSHKPLPNKTYFCFSAKIAIH